ncbi:MAG: porin family protein [Gammaproteobacteria bacterium]|nr:porin family protein [Gammaproteobacteria bacterium]
MRFSYLKKLLIILLMLAGMINSSAASENQDYVGIQYSLVDYENTRLGTPLTHKPTVLVTRMGRFINHHFAVEARMGVGLSDDKITVSIPGYRNYDTSIKLGVESLFGFYALGNFPVTSRFDIYGLVGYTSIDATVTASVTTSSGSASATASGTESGFSYGMGTRIGINDELSFNFEYINYFDEDELVIESINAGFLFNY